MNKNITNPLRQWSLAPAPWTGTRPRPVRNWGAQQEVRGRQGSEASFVFAAAPRC